MQRLFVALSDAARSYITDAAKRLEDIATAWENYKSEQIEITREMLADLNREIRAALAALNLRGFTEPA